MQVLSKIVALFITFSFLNANDTENMVRISGGEYVPLYSLDSQIVIVEDFYMDIYPVTNFDYSNYLNDYPEWNKDNIKSIFADKNYLKHWNNVNTYPKEYKNKPITYISWFAAKKYCECVGKRLPTNAEWEIAAKASKDKADGSNDKNFNQMVLDYLSESSKKEIGEVGKGFKNYFGVYDLHGLVMEWTYNFNEALTTGESRGNVSLDDALFCGGGSFASKDLNNYAAFMRYALRSSLKAKYSVRNLGFRCVKEI